MRQLYIRNYWLIFVLGILFLSTSINSMAQQLSDDQTATLINSANGPQQVHVKIFGGSSVCTNGILALTLPAGYSYKPNSAFVTPYNAADVAGLAIPIGTESIAGSTINLTIPTIAAGNYVVVTYEASAACGAETGNISYTLNACGAPASTEVGPVNIQKAKFNISINPETYVAPSTGVTYTRNIVIKNDGIGKVDTVYLDRTAAAGFTYGAYTVTPGTGVTIINQSLTGNRYQIITSGLAIGQSVTIAETVTINSATNISANYDAWFGPNGVKCIGQNGTGVGSAIITTTPPDPSAPGLALVVTSWPSLKCPGSDYVTIRVTNTNTTQAATLTSMIGYLNGHPGATTANVGQRSFFLENNAEISTSSATGPWVSLNASTRVGGYAYNAGHNVGQAIHSTMTGTAGDITIPPGAIYYVRYKVAYNPIAETCPSNNASYWYFPRLQTAYTMAGATRTADSDNAASNYWQIGSPFDSSAPDAVGGTPYVINMNFNVRLLNQTQFNDNTGAIKLVFNLPTALIPSLAPADNTITDGTNTLTPTSVTFIGGKLTLIFNNPLDAARFSSNVSKRWTTNIKTQFNCSGANVSYSYSMDAYAQMASCGPDIKLLCGAVGNFEAHSCNPCAIDAATTNGASLTRTTIGTIINPANPINSSHFVIGDRANFTVSGSVNTTTPGKEFQYLFVNMNPLGLTYGTQYQFEAGTTASAIVTRGGVDYTITNIPLVGTTPLTGETHTIRLHTGTLPAALGGKFLANDLVKVIVPLQFLVNADQYLNIKGTLYAADVAEPTIAERLFCDHGFTARGRAVLVNQTVANGASVTFSNCAQVTSGLEGRFDISYKLNEGTNTKVFNNEIREFFTTPNTFTIRTRDFEQITQIRVVVNYQQTGVAPNVIFTPLSAPVPDGAGYHLYTFDISTLMSNLADPRINQSALIQIFPRYKIICASSDFSGAAYYSNLFYPLSGKLNHLNQATVAVAQAVDGSNNGIFKAVNITTGAPIKTIDGNTATWDVHIANPYNIAKGNVWLAPSATAGFSSIKVFEITTIGATATGTEVAKDAAGIYQLGSIGAYDNKYYRIVGVLADCNQTQKLDMVYDFNCEAYPTSLQGAKDGCRTKVLNLEARSTPASFQVSIQSQPTSPHIICDDLTYTFRINNSSLAIVKDLGLKLSLDGVSYVANSLQVAMVNGLATPGPGDYSIPATGSVTSLGAGNYDVSILGSQITAGEFIWIKVSFKPDGCNFVSGQRLQVSAHGKDSCGNVKVSDNEVLSDRINIDGMPTLLPTVEITSSATPIIANANGSFSVSTYTLKIQNTGSVAIDAGSGYGFDFKLPANWTFVPTSISYTSGTATYVGVSPTTGEHQFSFSAGLLPGQSVELTAPLTLVKEYVGTLVCGAQLQIHESVFAKFKPTGACAATCEINHVIDDNSALSLIVPTPAAPTGSANQQFCDNAIEANKPTLANVALTGSKFVRWYDSPAKLDADSIPSTTKLVNGTTYYVRNAHVDNGTCQSIAFAVTVVVKPLITLTSVVEKCDAAGLNYKLTVTVNGTAPFTAIGTGAAGTWVGNVWTSADILAGTPYDINFTDASACNTLNVKDDAPACCAFTVVCPTFAPTTVSCYSAVPTKSKYTLAEFTALGGAVSADNCGVIEITASNSADLGCNGVVTRTYKIVVYDDVNANGIKDAGENTVLFSRDCLQTITVKDETAPTGVAPSGTIGINACYVNPATVPIGTPVFNAATAAAGYTDNCGAVVTATLKSTVVEGDNCAWTVTYTFDVTDACGNKLENQQIVHTGGDKTAPQFVGTLPANIKAVCGAIPEPAILTAADNCGTATVSFTETIGAGCGSAIVRTWTATDACGNQTVHSQTITVEDNIAPVFTGALPGNITVNCDQIPLAATLTATDNCASPEISFNEVKTAGNCANEYILTRTWTAKDICGNAITHTQIIKVEDKTPPVFTGTLPGNITVSCDQIPAAATLTAIDNCGAATVTYVEVKSTGACEEGGFSITRTWTAIDACGNTTIHKQVITVENNSPAIKVEKTADVQLVRETGDVIKYTIVVTNTGNLTLRNVKVVDPLTGMSETIALLAPGEKRTFTTTYTVKISDFNSNKIINVVTTTGTDPKGNPVTDDDKEEVVIEPLKLNIPNVITPNGDGKNDTFFIDGLEGYLENNLIIFNRWNNEVYNSHGYYKNNWSGQGLNDGTYYYLLKIKNKSGVWQNLTGHITLLKRN